MQMLYKWYPLTSSPTDLAISLVASFQEVYNSIRSDCFQLESNDVLKKLRPGLERIGFTVESGKKRNHRIIFQIHSDVSVKNGREIQPDAFHQEAGFLIEVEGGGAATNSTFIKDIIRPCLVPQINFLCIAMSHKYNKSKRKSGRIGGITPFHGYRMLISFLDAVYTSNRIVLPYKGILAVGY